MAEGGRRRDRLGLLVGAAVGVIVGDLLGLATTGAWLGLHYRPQASDAFPDFAPPSDDPIVQDVHRWMAYALLPLLVVAVFVIAAAFARRRGASGWYAGLIPLSFLAAVVALATGVLLPWDQLALEAVTVGSNLDGYEWLVGQRDVRFAIVDGAEVSPRTMALLFVAHVLAWVTIAATAAIAISGAGRRAAGRSDPARSPQVPATGPGA